MASSGATKARMFSFIIPLSWVTATERCRKERPSSSRSCRGRRVRKLPTDQRSPRNLHPVFVSTRQTSPLCRPFYSCSVVLGGPWPCYAFCTLGRKAPAIPVTPRKPYNRRMNNKTIARILRETAQLLEIDGAIIGRYRSYEKAAELISGMHESIEELAKDPDKLEELPGIGERMAEHLQEILKTGDYSLRKKLLKKYTATLLDLLPLQSLGPKKVAFLWSNFQAATVSDVEKLALEGKLREVPGFGEKSEQNILKAVEAYKRSTGRFLLQSVEVAAAALQEHITKAGKAAESVTPAGSLRRGKETVGDLDLLVTLGEGYTAQK